MNRPSHRKNWFPGRWVVYLVVVAAILWWGVQPESINSSSLMTRIQAADHMGQALDALGNFCRDVLLKKNHFSLAYSDLPASLAPGAKNALALGLLSGFPDRTFRPNEPMVVGELLEGWVQLIRYVQGALKTPAPALFPDLSRLGITPQHWFYEDLQVLISIGALSEKALNGLDLERTASDLDVRDLLHATVEYFSRDFIILEFTSHGWKIGFKGAEKPLTSQNWQYQIGAETGFQALPESGEIAIPGVPATELTLENPLFEKVHVDAADRMIPYILVPLQEAKGEGKARVTKKEKKSAIESTGAIQAGPAAEITETHGFTGVVVDSLSKKPIPSANVVVDGIVVVTGPTGKFSFNQLKKDQLAEVFISASGYQSLSIKKKIGFKNREFTALLKPYTSALKVRVISAATSDPIAGVAVSINGTKLNASKSGNFEIRNLKPGYHKLELKAVGFQDEHELLFVDESPSTRTIKLQPRSSFVTN